MEAVSSPGIACRVYGPMDCATMKAPRYGMVPWWRSCWRRRSQLARRLQSCKEAGFSACSVGHRLGFQVYVSADFGNDKFTHANVGRRIVAALKWINENIEKFGEIARLGQSGGGGSRRINNAIRKGLFTKQYPKRRL